MKVNNMKQTLQKKLHSRKLRKPGILYIILGYLWKLLFYKKYNINVTYKTNIKKVKEPFILLSNHASRLDYMFVGIPLLPNKYNFVAGYNEFFRSHLQGVFKLLKVIPDKTYVKLQYRYITHHKLNLRNPIRYTEKLQYLRVYTYPKNPLVSKCASRDGLREYATSLDSYINDHFIFRNFERSKRRNY